MTFRQRQLRMNGPMFCKGGRCPEFRTREPELAQRMQDAEIIAHYMGTDVKAFGGEYFYLDGITPISRAALMRILEEREAQHE